MMLTNGGSPMADQVPADRRDKILHARLMVGDEVLMGSDAPPERYEQAKGFFRDAPASTIPAMPSAFFAICHKMGRCRCRSRRPSGPSGFGMLVDQFGIPWMINCEEATP